MLKIFFTVRLLQLCVILLAMGYNAQGVMASTYQVTDSFGKHYFDAPPQRIVVTDWAVLEQMLELGIVPVGAPELDRYRQYVHTPQLPVGIRDIGLRRAPKMAAIKALKPDVIIIGTDQKSLARPFSRISRVMYYKSFSDKYRTNGKKSRVRFKQIAQLFQQEALAQRKLLSMDLELAKIKKQIDQHFNGQPPQVTLIRFSSDKKCLVYGENSMASHTLKSLGLSAYLSSKRSKWGEREIAISQLRDIKSGVVLYIKPVNNPAVFESEIWHSLPMVQNKQVFSMEPVWSYGGAMSVLYHARAIRDVLLKIEK